MNSAMDTDMSFVRESDLILVTGATGFIGVKVVRNLLDRGFRNIRCFIRRSSKARDLQSLTEGYRADAIQFFQGNLLSPADCVDAAKDAKVVIHLAAGRGEKSYPDAFMNSVVTTRNLLEACAQNRCIRRFVNVSSFAVYANRGGMLDEKCAMENRPELRGEAYCFAKTKQDQIVMEYGDQGRIPYVIVRPGVVYGAGNLAISGRVGIGTFGIFLHLGGSNRIPLSYVDNCADAIALAAIKPGIDGEVFNVVDDYLPTSRQFLRLYKQNVKRFRSIYVPKAISHVLCGLWERYSKWSEGQLPPVFNRNRWDSLWRKTAYTNAKLKAQLGWRPTVSTREGLKRYFKACREAVHA
jgi:nucleoside-diphosphate-sugar epimerase